MPHTYSSSHSNTVHHHPFHNGSALMTDTRSFDTYNHASLYSLHAIDYCNGDIFREGNALEVDDDRRVDGLVFAITRRCVHVMNTVAFNMVVALVNMTRAM